MLALEYRFGACRADDCGPDICILDVQRPETALIGLSHGFHPVKISTVAFCVVFQATQLWQGVRQVYSMWVNKIGLNGSVRCLIEKDKVRPKNIGLIIFIVDDPQ